MNVKLGLVLASVNSVHNTAYTMDDIACKSRIRPLCGVRQMFIYIAYRLGGGSTNTLGRMVCRNHSTVVHSVRVVEDEMCTSQSFKRKVEKATKLYHDSLKQLGL